MACDSMVSQIMQLPSCRVISRLIRLENDTYPIITPTWPSTDWYLVIITLSANYFKAVNII